MTDWISVNDRLPEKSGKYLVYTENTGVETCRWALISGKWNGGAWTSRISHWMPLPNSPKEK